MASQERSKTPTEKRAKEAEVTSLRRSKSLSSKAKASSSRDAASSSSRKKGKEPSTIPPVPPLPSYTCIICTEEGYKGYLQLEKEHLVCIPCLRNLFERAIADETEYPAHWGPKELNIEHFAKWLDYDLVKRYREKIREYACPIQERVYCGRTDPPRRPDPCWNFIGGWQNRKICRRCDKCMWYVCMRCAEPFSPSVSSPEAAIIEHDCDPRNEAILHARVMEGMERGKDFQQCPNSQCKRIWAMWDGCNHMRCTCGTHFCFVCGNVVVDGHGHWKSNGGCPRWNQPGDDNAIFDDNDRYNDNEDFDEADYERRLARVAQQQAAEERRLALLRGLGLRRRERNQPDLNRRVQRQEDARDREVQRQEDADDRGVQRQADDRHRSVRRVHRRPDGNRQPAPRNVREAITGDVLSVGDWFRRLVRRGNNQNQDRHA